MKFKPGDILYHKRNSDVKIEIVSVWNRNYRVNMKDNKFLPVPIKFVDDNYHSLADLRHKKLNSILK